MPDEIITVLVPPEGLVVQLDEGRFTKWHAVHPSTDAPNRVVVSESSMGSFKLQVVFDPPVIRRRSIQEMPDEEGIIRRLPTFALSHPDPVPVEAEVSYYISGE